MRRSAGLYSFDLPDKWKGMVGTKKKGNRTDFVLLWEEDLYWRLRDQLWMVLESIVPAEGWDIPL